MMYSQDEVYAQIAKMLPEGRPIKLLDLGCCTGLEYEVFMRVNPETEVTGIKEEESLRKMLKEKAGKRVEHLRLIYGDYFNVDLGVKRYDVAMSVMGLNEFSRKNKLTLYKKVFHALNSDGIYIEQDYVTNEDEIVGSISNVFSKQISLLLESGFQRVEKAWYRQNTIILKAIK